jgi:hypothetical protein
MFLTYRLQHLEHFIDMSLRGTLREEDVTDNSLHVDDVRHAPLQPESCGHAASRPHRHCHHHLNLVTPSDAGRQAGWHRSKELQVPANIRLIEQPAYSPEVNPVKHVWEELR